MGLGDSEARLYLAALQLGKSLPKHLAEKAGVKRPTLYQLLPKLIDKGLLSETWKGKRRYLVAEDPAAYLESKKSELSQFEEIIPSLRSLLNTASAKPIISFYEGLEGIKKVYLDNLRVGKPLMDFVGLTNMHPEIADYSNKFYIRERIRRKIPLQVIISGLNTYGKMHLLSSAKQYREVRVVEENLFPCPLEIFIYQETVSFIIYRQDSEPAGVIIRSKEISTSIRSLFKLAWLGAKKLD